jgi:glycosyltransferase involved in cell wall biosynthesis
MRVHQLLARMEMGDAVSNQALAIHEVLRSWGLESRIFAHGVDAPSRRLASLESEYEPFMKSKDDLLIYHYSTYCDNYRLFLEARHRKVLIYHNITPAEFFDKFNPDAAEMCRRGREVLPLLKDCDLALGDSDFNRRELVEAGFEEGKSGVLPINPPLDKLDAVEEDREFLRRLEDGKVNLLFVGRIVPNKKVEDIIKLFCCYHRGVNARSRLLLVGSLLSTYHSALVSLVRGMGVEDRVWFMGKVSDSRLKACYLGSHYYISMSEHEGFCVPLLEAFHFGLPVLAYAAGAVPETMAAAGILFREKDYVLLAELLDRLERDAVLKERVLAAQRERLAVYESSSFEENLRRALGGLLGMEREGEGAVPSAGRR